jgi:hypothetical protein
MPENEGMEISEATASIAFILTVREAQALNDKLDRITWPNEAEQNRILNEIKDALERFA